jgi:hypothetical protein
MNNKFRTQLPKLALLLLPTLLLAACGGSNGNNGADVADAAVIATRTPSYDAGAVSLVGVEAPYTAQTNVETSENSDLVVRSGGDHYFLIKRYNGNQVLRYEAKTPSMPTWTYSTQDAGDGEIQSNPADLIIASATKAYLLRYGSGKLWIVNPSATTEANFKTGEIDLSAYDSDGVPEMTTGLIKDGKLYVLMQRLQFFDATQVGSIAVIDVASNTVQRTIDLPVYNPSGLAALPGSNKILVTAAGSYGSYPDYVIQYNGGLVSLDTSTNTATMLFDDGDGTTHAYGQFVELAVAASDRAYFIGSTGFGADQTLYRINPSVTPITPVVVSGFSAKSLGSLAVDPAGKLWVSRTDDAAPGVSILGYSGGNETVAASVVDTVLTPINIDFISVPTE